MAHLRFRLVSIELDADEDPSGVTALVRDDTLKVITDMIGTVTVTADATTVTRADELTIRLPLAQARDLFCQVGQIPTSDPRHEHTTEVYDSLTAVFYGLMRE
jgi:hypothetical protein